MTFYTKEAIQSYDRDEAHHFVSLLLKALPIQQGERHFEIEGVSFLLTYHKTPLKREANLKMKVGDQYYTCKYLHSTLNHIPATIANEITAFILNHKERLEGEMLKWNGSS